MPFVQRKNFAIPLTVLAWAALLPCHGFAAEFIWWEGEKPDRTNFPQSTWFSPQNDVERGKLSGGDWLTNNENRKPGSEEAFAIYTIDIPADGTYELWTRKFWKHGPFRWRFGQQPWQICGRDIALADSVDLRTHVSANWVYLGTVQLTQGRHTFELRLLAEVGQSLTAGFDAFCLTPTAFFPSGKLKPGEKSGLSEPGRFSVEPPPDPFTDAALLNLRSLNEPLAGKHGWITANSAGLWLPGADGAPSRQARFFGVNVSASNAAQSRRSVDYLAARLARLGVNVVRFHSPMFSARDIEQVDPKKLDDLHYLVAAMKRQGIYTHLSFYFPLWVNVRPEHGLEGFDAIKNKHPFGLIYFNERLQNLHRGWMRQIMTAPNPYTGTTLADEPALAFVELVNEDSLFFWTFTRQNVPAVHWEALEARYALWLSARPDLAGIKPELFDVWHLTRDGMAKASPQRRRAVEAQVLFLAQVQRDFYARASTYMKKTLGYGGLVIASNWKTADPALLDGVERWTYQACDIIDKHGYFGGRHSGEGSTYSVRVGHEYEDRTILRHPAALPVQMIGDDRPMMVSELGWPQPNRHRAEMMPVSGAYASLHGISVLHFFAMGSNYVRDTAIDKFQLATPAVTATMPASALMFRRGDVAGEVVGTIPPTIDEDGRLHYAPAAVVEHPSIDELRRTGREQASDGVELLVGRILRRAGEAGGLDLAPHVADGIIRAAGGSLAWDRRSGVMTIDSPRTQGALGFLGERGRIRLSDVEIECGNDYAIILVTALDDAPIRQSRRLLVTAVTDDRPYGFSANEGRITSLGQFPFTVERINAGVTIRRDDAREPRITVLDPNGYSSGPGGTRLPEDAMHSLWEYP